MAKKLTLYIDNDLIDFAHDYARQNGLSVSKLVELYLAALKPSVDKDDLHRKTASLYGVFQDEPVPDKKELRKIFHEKDID